MDNKLKMAVIGAGYIGQLHSACMSQVENIELAAIVEPVEELGKEVAEAFGCEYLSSLEDLKDRPDIQAVNICVPEEYHLETAVKCAEMGKHIFIEKPLAKTVRECREIIAACKKNQVRLMVAHTCHFINEYRKLKNEFDEGEIGEISQINISRFQQREDMDRFKGRVSILYYIGVHDLEAVQWITGHKITGVSARKVDSMRLFGEEGYAILFEMDNGACGTMSLGWQLPDEMPVYIDTILFVGDKGAIYYDQNQTGITKYSAGMSAVSANLGMLDGKIIGPYTQENYEFAQAILTGGEFRMDTNDAMGIIAVVEAIQRSAETGQFVPVEV